MGDGSRLEVDGRMMNECWVQWKNRYYTASLVALVHSRISSSPETFSIKGEDALLSGPQNTGRAITKGWISLKEDW